MKALDIILEYNTYIVMTLILVFCAIFVGKAQFYNGKIEVCENSGMNYHIESDTCKTCEELGGRWSRYNQCVIREDGREVTDTDMKKIDPGYGGVDFYG